ncbi:hypothetical protein ACFWJT_34790 [Streptomyces sp. NPDC127069]|uniref:hypothetical protein n=1 Tax=Streptomyces sp. NPDC127069 TaxID=3347128 RepID=UPI0036470045
MAGVADEGTGRDDAAGGGARPARRGLDPLKPEVFEKRPHKRALVEHLRSLIGAADLASKQVASGAALSASALSKNLSGERLPHRSTIEAIIQLCGASEEVRALSLRLHTAALGEAHPAFAERLVMADAYEETVLLHDRLQARLEDVLGEQRRRQADYDDLLARHETTMQAVASAEDELRTQRQHHQEETSHLNTLLQEQQDAHQRDRTALDARLGRARADHEDQLRAREQEEARLRRDLLAQEDKIRSFRGLLEDSAAEASALRQERDRLRMECARMREDLVGLQVELAAAEAGRDNPADGGMLAPALLAVGEVLDRHSAPREEGEAAGRLRVAGAATWHSNPVAPSVAAQPEPGSTPKADRLKRPSAGFIAVGMVLLLTGPFLHTGGPMADSRPTVAGWWCIASGVVLLLTGLILMTVRDVKNTPAATADPGEPYDYTYNFPPLV